MAVYVQRDRDGLVTEPLAHHLRMHACCVNHEAVIILQPYCVPEPVLRPPLFSRAHDIAHIESTVATGHHG